MAISNAALGGASLFAPKLSERMGQVAAIVLMQGLSVIPLALISSSGSFYSAALLYVTRTGLMNLSAPILNAYMMSMVSQDERASASGVITMAWNGAYAAGSAASGVLMGIYLDSPIYVGSLLYISSSIALYAYFWGLGKKLLSSGRIASSTLETRLEEALAPSQISLESGFVLKL